MKHAVLLTALLALFSVAAFADIPQPRPIPTPKPSKDIDTDLVVHFSREIKVAKLSIPKDQIKQLRAQLDALDTDDDNTAATTGNSGRMQTIAGGLFLSLALVFGGIWFVRSGKAANKTKTIAVVSLFLAVGSAATIVFANAGPPPSLRSVSGKWFSSEFRTWNYASGKIKLEVNGYSNAVELYVPDTDGKPNGEE